MTKRGVNCVRGRSRTGLPQDVVTDGVRKASLARAPDAPVSGEDTDIRTARPDEGASVLSHQDGWYRRSLIRAQLATWMSQSEGLFRPNT